MKSLIFKTSKFLISLKKFNLPIKEMMKKLFHKIIKMFVYYMPLLQ